MFTALHSKLLYTRNHHCYLRTELLLRYDAPSTSKFSVLGAFNAEQGKILGNWGYGTSVTDGGTWEMTKK